MSNYLWLASIIAVALLVGALSYYFDQRRLKAIATAFNALGGRAHMRADSRIQDAAVAAIPGVSLRNGASGVRWFATATINGLEAAMYEHRYSVQAGKSRRTVVHTVIGVAAPRQWPALRLTSERLTHKIAGWFGKHDFQVEDPDFNRRWRITTDDENFALVFLTPRMQETCKQIPQGCEVMVGFGSLAVVCKGKLKPQDIAATLALPVSLLACVPEELMNPV